MPGSPNSKVSASKGSTRPHLPGEALLRKSGLP